MTEKLKPCPFCGGEAIIQLTDDEGNFKDESYLENAYSGIGYVITHDVVDANGCCPIAKDWFEAQGCYIYASKQEAINAWNRRFNDDSNEKDDFYRIRKMNEYRR